MRAALVIGLILDLIACPYHCVGCHETAAPKVTERAVTTCGCHHCPLPADLAVGEGVAGKEPGRRPLRPGDSPDRPCVCVAQGVLLSEGIAETSTARSPALSWLGEAMLPCVRVDTASGRHLRVGDGSPPPLSGAKLRACVQSFLL